MRANGPVIEQGQEPGSAVAAAHAKNRVHFAVTEQLHQVAGAFAVGAGKKTPALADVGSEPGFKTELFDDFDGAVYRFWVRWRAGRGDDADGVAGVETGRLYQREHDFKLLILILILILIGLLRLLLD